MIAWGLLVPFLCMHFVQHEITFSMCYQICKSQTIESNICKMEQFSLGSHNSYYGFWKLHNFLWLEKVVFPLIWFPKPVNGQTFGWAKKLRSPYIWQWEIMMVNMVCILRLSILYQFGIYTFSVVSEVAVASNFFQSKTISDQYHDLVILKIFYSTMRKIYIWTAKPNFTLSMH